MNVKDYRQQVEANLNSAGTQHLMAAELEEKPEDSWGQELKVLGDAGQNTEARLAALQHLQAGQFLTETFSEYRPAYINALRIAAIAENADLRRRALDALVNLNDEFARQKLTERLRNEKAALVPPAFALDLLARDDHGSAHDIARELLESSMDISIRAQAVRVLGSDPSAEPLLSNIMRNKAEFREVRRASAVALHGLDRASFVNGAHEILSDPEDFPDIKASMQGALERSESLDEVGTAGTTHER